MKLENLKAVRNSIAATPAKFFDMTTFANDHPCGTVMCIGGTAAVLAGNDAKDLVNCSQDYIETEAAEFLGLKECERNHLFYGEWSKHAVDEFEDTNNFRRKITKAETLRYLDKAIIARNIMVNA